MQRKKSRNPRPATENWVSNASRVAPKTTNAELTNIPFLPTTATTFSTVSLQRCAEKGKLAPPGVWEVVTTTNLVYVLNALWIIKWLSLKSKLFFINFQQIGEILFPSRHIFIKYIVMESYLNLKTGEIKSNSTYKCKWSLFI